MNAKIYYFTGSGNSLAVARDIACRIHAEVISIPSVINQTTIKAETDALGIIFPVYYQGLPVVIGKFAEKPEDLSSTYVFAVCTSGGGPALSLKYLQKQLKVRKGDLAGGFSVLEGCNGCGICSRICPAHSIDMKEKKPHWSHQCEQCFACLQWCPNEAIKFGNQPVHSKRYHHPEITLTDMIQSNQTINKEVEG